MQAAWRSRDTWLASLLGFAVMVGADNSCRADDTPDSPAPPAVSTSSAKPPRPKPPAKPISGPPSLLSQIPNPDAPSADPAVQPDKKRDVSSAAAGGSNQPLDVEAPSLQGPSGISELPERPPAVSTGDLETASDVEAPTLAGPSGGQLAPPGEGFDPNAPWWTRVPNVQPFPPPGNAIVPPRGRGYYTLLEFILGDRRDAPPKYPYPRFGVIQFSFYNTDWRYLDRISDDRDRDYFDFLKRIRLGDNFLFTTGGEWRGRYNNEVDSRLTGVDNTYYQGRTRIYGELWYRDRFHLFAEFINAQTFDADLPPQAGDQYNPNFLNLFADANLGRINKQPLWLRVGRQELLYGSQRLISPLDWPNTRRTFQGVKLFWQNEKFSLDGFVVQPVIPSANSFASVDWKQVFSAVWGTYRPARGQVIDLYYLNLQNSNLAFLGQFGAKGTQNVSTAGSRWYADKNNWLLDVEAMIQFGRYSNQGLMANAYTMGGGYYFSKRFMNPTIWVYFDHASGQPGPPGSSGVHQTFNQLFPFNHYYFGMMDLVGRQNINDYHVDLSFFPVKWWTVWAQYHILRLDSPFDALYNSSGIAIRSDPTGRAGINVGEILSIVNNFTIDLHQNVLVQYSHLYAGDFIRHTGSGRSPDELYLMYSYRW